MAAVLGEESAAAKLQRRGLASADRVPSRKLLFLDTSCLIDLVVFASAVPKVVWRWTRHL